MKPKEKMYTNIKTATIAVVITIFAIMLSACTGSSPVGHPDLEGTTWVLTTSNQNLPIEGTQLTITFEDGQVSGNAGCNHYGGSYQIKGDSISFNALEMTEMGCMEPEGVMEQERIYLELLGNVQRFELVDGELTIYADLEQTMTFRVHSTTVVATPIPISNPPYGFKEYQDREVGISVFIPEDWVVFVVIEGDYAIFTSYPEDKYIGGEAREPGDTKCDLNLHPSFTGSAVELINQWKSSPMTTILAEEEIILDSGEPATRIEIDNRGHSVSMVTEINDRVISLTCWGEFDQFDEIAVTLKASE